jgi:hypothetical protein
MDSRNLVAFLFAKQMACATYAWITAEIIDSIDCMLLSLLQTKD